MALGPLIRDASLRDNLVDDHLGTIAAAFVQYAFDDDTVSENRASQSLHVIRDHVISPFNECHRLDSSVQSNRSAGADTQLQLLVASCGMNDVEHIIVNGIINADLTRRFLQLPVVSTLRSTSRDGYQIGRASCRERV